MAPRLLKVKPQEGYRLWVSYDDGLEGTVDLSGLIGKGEFVLWKDEVRFRQVRVGDRQELLWSEEIALCADALYLQIAGKRPEEVFTNLRVLSESHA